MSYGFTMMTVISCSFVATWKVGFKQIFLLSHLDTYWRHLNCMYTWEDSIKSGLCHVCHVRKGMQLKVDYVKREEGWRCVTSCHDSKVWHFINQLFGLVLVSGLCESKWLWSWVKAQLLDGKGDWQLSDTGKCCCYYLLISTNNLKI